jgi:membrane dipeptidase
VGDGCHEDTDAGLSRFGREVVAEMNRVGMVVDVSHTGYKTSLEAMEMSVAPVIISHAYPQKLFQHARNIGDEQIKACARTGGIIGIHGVAMFIGATKKNIVTRMLKGIDYVAQMVGAGHASIGSDYMYLDGSDYAFFHDNQHLYPEGYPSPPWTFLSPEQLPELTEAMLCLGYKDSDIEGILGSNYLRVAQSVWK